jgi:hypothetical protein
MIADEELYLEVSCFEALQYTRSEWQAASKLIRKPDFCYRKSGFFLWICQLTSCLLPPCHLLPCLFLPLQHITAG